MNIKELFFKKTSIKRTDYVNTLIKNADLDLIKVVCGIRRAGKSELLKYLMKELLTKGIKQENIIYLSLIEYEKYEFNDHIGLIKWVINQVKDKNKKYYVIFDEIQKINQWEKAIVSLFEKKNLSIYISGSNSQILKNKLATLLSGRYIEINIYPFSFKETIKYYQDNKINLSIDEIWNNYLLYGGFAESFEITSIEEKTQYFETLLNNIIVNDILPNNNINDIDTFKSFVRYCLLNVSKKISLKKLINLLSDKKIQFSFNTAKKYLEYQMNVFLLDEVKYLSNSTKEEFELLSRYYCVDHGLRNALIYNKQLGIGRILENIVAIELFRRGYKINGLSLNNIRNVKDDNNKEIDFVAYKHNDAINIQVCEVLDDKNIDKEIGNFTHINNNNSNILLCLKSIYINRVVDGVKVISLIDWLRN